MMVLRRSIILFRKKSLTFRDHTNPLIYPDIDWYDYVLKKAVPQTQHNLSISGGTDRARYFISLGYLYQQGLFETFGTDKNNNFCIIDIISVKC